MVSDPLTGTPSMTERPTHREGLILLTLLATSSLTVMAGATLSPALPAITVHFAEAPGAELLSRLVLTLPALFIALFSPIGGLIADKLGRRPLLLWSTVLYVLAGSAGLVVDSLTALLASRALLGIAVAGLMTASTTLIGDYFSDSRRNRVLGLQAACMAFGGVLFLLAGGLLADVHWRMPFLIYAVPIILLPLIMAIIREPGRGREGGIDQVADPDPPWATFGGLYLMALLGMGLFYLLPVQIPYYLRELGYTSATVTGIALSLNTVAAALSSLAYRHVRSRMDPWSILLLTFLSIAVGLLLLFLAHGPAVLACGLILIGAGLGLLMPNLSQWLLAVAPRTIRGRVISGLTTSIFLGQFLSPLVTQPVSQALGLRASFGLFAIVTLLVIVGIFMTRLIRQTTKRAAV